ncbi:MAG: hypothetical protein J6Y48_19670 [Clostridia bacterium]|nr:hypothetical protein [Clostridia bacterium]
MKKRQKMQFAQNAANVDFAGIVTDLDAFEKQDKNILSRIESYHRLSGFFFAICRQKVSLLLAFYP